MQNTPLAASYNSYLLMAAAAAAADNSGQGLPAQPIGSLEALRHTWHAPHLPGQAGWQPGSLGGQSGSLGGQHGQQQQQSPYGQTSNGTQLQHTYVSSLQQLQQEQIRCLDLALPPSDICSLPHTSPFLKECERSLWSLVPKSAHVVLLDHSW